MPVARVDDSRTLFDACVEREIKSIASTVADVDLTDLIGFSDL